MLHQWIPASTDYTGSASAPRFDSEIGINYGVEMAIEFLTIANDDEHESAVEHDGEDLVHTEEDDILDEDEDKDIF